MHHINLGKPQHPTGEDGEPMTDAKGAPRKHVRTTLLGVTSAGAVVVGALLPWVTIYAPLPWITAALGAALAAIAARQTHRAHWSLPAAAATATVSALVVMLAADAISRVESPGIGGRIVLLGAAVSMSVGAGAMVNTARRPQAEPKGVGGHDQ